MLKFRVKVLERKHRRMAAELKDIKEALRMVMDMLRKDAVAEAPVTRDDMQRLAGKPGLEGLWKEDGQTKEWFVEESMKLMNRHNR